MRGVLLGSSLLAFSALVGCEADHDAPRASRLEIANDDRSLTDVERLGKAIFEDTRLSEPPGQACASCHVARAGFSGNNGSRIPAVALGSRPEMFGNRNVPTAMYAQFSPPFAFVAEVGDDGKTELTPTGGQFWDGRATSLDEQAKGPFLNVREMNNPNRETVVAKMRDGSYASLFRKVFGDGALDDASGAYDRAAEAIAAFERTPRFAPFSSKFDDFLRGEAELDPRERRGFALFVDPEKGNCISCHVGELGSHEPSDWLFTDFTYDNLGVPRNRLLPDNADDQSFDLGLCKQEGIAQRVPAGVVLESLCGAFKVPTLRNVAATAPYMHNGYFTDLHDVVRFYVTRDTNPERWYPGAKFDDLPPPYWKNVNTSEVPYDRKPGETPRLNEEEIDAVVTFLETLTDR
jgi:cytochrome c peroxidase